MNVNKGSRLTLNQFMAKNYEPPVSITVPKNPLVEDGAKPMHQPQVCRLNCPTFGVLTSNHPPSAEEMIMDTARMINPGQPIQWYGAEDRSSTGTLSHHVTLNRRRIWKCGGTIKLKKK